jgi:phenylacetate-CoA ligase
MILNPVAETMSQSEKAALQGKKLRMAVDRVYEKTRFYYELFHSSGVSPDDIKSINDISRLPFTTREDLASQSPFGLLTMPLSGVARFERSPDSGIVNGLTAQDINSQQELIARCLVACHITTTSVLLYLPETYPSISARSLQQSAEMLGVTVVTAQAGDALSQLKTICDFGVTTLWATPMRLLTFADALHKKGHKLQDLPLMNLLCEQRYYSSALEQQLADIFRIPVYTLYGNPDILSIGIAGECYAKQGLHIQDDHFYPEIIHPETGNVLEPGQPGELVLTTLSREAMPLIRFRTGQKALAVQKNCPCGRSSVLIHFPD